MSVRNGLKKYRRFTNDEEFYDVITEDMMRMVIDFDDYAVSLENLIEVLDKMGLMEIQKI